MIYDIDMETELFSMILVLFLISSPDPPIHTYSAITLFLGIFDNKPRKSSINANDFEFNKLYGFEYAIFKISFYCVSRQLNN